MKMTCKYGLALLSLFIQLLSNASDSDSLRLYPASHPFIKHAGRIDFTNPEFPRFWQPGVYFTFSFKGSACEIILNDEELWGSFHNYIEVVLDGKAVRLQTKQKTDTIRLQAERETIAGIHLLEIYKNTEANIGWLELVGVRCRQLVRTRENRSRRMEFIGNSITCGTGSDASKVACGKGKWQDQHNAYLSYGSITARKLGADFHLSAVSGIGLMRSCCNMNIIMPQVIDKISMRNDTIGWDFKLFQPDVVTVCLGQNDGVQDSLAFVNNYISFLKKLRGHYPAASIVCLASPMADVTLAAFMKKMLTAITNSLNQQGDRKVTSYFFSKQFHNGCDHHPDLAEHQQIADELIAYVKKIMKW